MATSQRLCKITRITSLHWHRHHFTAQCSHIHKLCYDKQVNLNKLQNESKLRHSPYFHEYSNCKSTNDVLNLIEQNEDSEYIISHYISALHRLAILKEFKLCWNIFSDITTNQKYLPLINTQLYTTMIWLSCYQQLSQPDIIRRDKLRQKKTCDKIFSILAAMKTKMNLEMDNDTISTVISSCAKLERFDRGEGFWKFIMEQGNIELNISVYNAMFDLYSKSDQMNEAYDLYRNLTNNQNIRCDDATFAILINGAHKHGDMETAQSLFDEAIEYLHPNKPQKDVYCALMNGYASRGDALKCWSLLIGILDNFEQNKDVNGYKVDIMCFSVMLKALSRINNDKKLRMKRRKNLFLEISMDDNKDGLQVEDVWKMIKFVLLKMKELDISRNVVIYGLLFHLCGDALGAQNCKYKVAKTFYDQMIAEGVECSSLCFHNFLKVGLCHFTVLEPDKRQKEAFAEFVLSEMKKYKVSISQQARLTMRNHGIDIVDYGGMLEEENNK